MVFKNKYLSAAYFDPQQAILYVMKDEYENEPFDLARFGIWPAKTDNLVIDHVQPTVILTHSHVDDVFLSFLNGNCQISRI
jgi:hypothetical protein